MYFCWKILPSRINIKKTQTSPDWGAIEPATDGNTFADETAVLIYDAGQIDSLLQAKWSDMKPRLAAGDIDGALTYYGSTTRDDYRAIFTALGTQLPQVAQEMQAIEMI